MSKSATISRENGKRLLASMPPKRPKSKYGNKKVIVPRAEGDLKFDSKREARHWGELCHLEASGEISGLERQVTYALVVNGVKVAKIVPDFRYKTHTGKLVIEDVKGGKATQTPVFKLKVKLFEALYPGLKITVIE